MSYDGPADAAQLADAVRELLSSDELELEGPAEAAPGLHFLTVDAGPSRYALLVLDAAQVARLSRLTFEAREQVAMWRDVVAARGGGIDTWTSRVLQELDVFRAELGFSPHGYGGELAPPPVVRVDRYTVRVDGHPVRATEDQERRLRAMAPEERAAFVRLMGGSS